MLSVAKLNSPNKTQHQCLECKLYYHPNCDDFLKCNLTGIESNIVIFKCGSCTGSSPSRSVAVDDATNSNLTSLKDEILLMQHKQLEMANSLTILANLKVQQDALSESLCKIVKQLDHIVNLEGQIELNSVNISSIQNDNTKIKAQLAVVSDKCNFLEQQLNGTKLLIYGLPHRNDVSLGELFKQICVLLNFDYSSNCIRNIFRIKAKSINKPVVVDWNSRILHQQFLTIAKLNRSVLAKTTLHGTDCSILITDYLSPAKKTLLYESKKLLQSTTNNFKFVWANRGIIYAKKEENSNVLKILSSDDLDKFKN